MKRRTWGVMKVSSCPKGQLCCRSGGEDRGTARGEGATFGDRSMRSCFGVVRGARDARRRRDRERSARRERDGSEVRCASAAVHEHERRGRFRVAAGELVIEYGTRFRELVMIVVVVL